MLHPGGGSQWVARSRRCCAPHCWPMTRVAAWSTSLSFHPCWPSDTRGRCQRVRRSPALSRRGRCPRYPTCCGFATVRRGWSLGRGWILVASRRAGWRTGFANGSAPTCSATSAAASWSPGGGQEGEGWPVGLAGVTLILRDQGAATSSVRRRRWGDAHHLIDPRRGLPARTGLEEVSVVAATGFEAEVVAKTALLLGLELAPTYCAAHALAWWLGGSRDD